ncbi:sec-independent protein translocase protein TatA [Rhodothalassium salexigens DSM 2132]|uniref:Sec-independent protein translocase protein TatA n=1 Tax=Rhodothalassium salexigens DSM 2132 TaxID=1188247 RepID=A0A4R2PTN4_RHOSA|nr:twin-arginine translocase TatA/TatE family subunit [Rhodothalassium salexigens]MBB4210340.1 sec-independent protein translocase protein TatA [Rhodothalassium salexigens DSM 2132]MBK1638881.1 twin-arginine translocase TatA/TatE family subunit [Rhodothalassium salexigens DSM 2132]TCP38504.1 sec-independent protein translocase protein TatA [Rhodothalassium salexigens DSM 2132]
MGVSVWQIIVIAVLVLLLFGRGKVSELMGDVAKGITSFRKGLREGDADDGEAADRADQAKSITDARETPVAEQRAETKDNARS